MAHSDITNGNSGETVYDRCLIDNPFLAGRVRDIEKAAGSSAQTQVVVDKSDGQLRQVRIVVTYQAKQTAQR